MISIENAQKKTVTTSANDELMDFTGTENYYSSKMFGCYYTEGVKYMAGIYNAYWLITLVGSHQHSLRFKEGAEFQVWELTKVEDCEFNIVCTDGNNNVLVKQKIGYSDFPFDTVKLYLTDSILMLPSEY
jgi:hypothetical protein